MPRCSRANLMGGLDLRVERDASALETVKSHR